MKLLITILKVLLKGLIIAFSALLTFTKAVWESQRFSPVRNFLLRTKDFLYNKVASLARSLTFLNNIKIRTRLFLFFAVLMIIPLSIVGIVTFRMSSNALFQQVSNSDYEIVRQVNRVLQSSVKETEGVFSFALNNDAIKSALLGTNAKDAEKSQIDEDNINQYITNMLKEYSTIDSIGIISTASSKVYGKAFGKLENGESAFWESDIYKSVVALDGKVLWKGFKENIFAKNEKLISCISILKDPISNTDLGVMVINLKPDFLRSILKGTRLGGDGNTSFFVLDESNFILSDIRGQKFEGVESSEKVLTYTINSLIERNSSQTLKDGLFEYKGGMAYFNVISGTSWKVVTMVPFNVADSQAGEIGLQVIWIAIGSALICLLMSLIMTINIVDPINEIVKTMKLVQNGDLTVRHQYERRDELAILGHSFNGMVGNIQKLVKNLSNTGKVLITNSDDITKSSEQLYMASEQVAIAISEIAREASEQARDVEVGANNMQDLSGGIVKVYENIFMLDDVAAKMVEVAESSKLVVLDLKQKSVETSNINDQVAKEIAVLNDSSKKIHQITKMIKIIAEKTKLLALNAQIEAAKTGGGKSGFSVIASEVRKLATDSKNAAELIGAMIDDIIKKSQNTEQVVLSSTNIVKKQLSVVDSTEKTFENIVTAMKTMITSIDDIKGSVTVINNSKEKTLVVVESISASAQQTAASVQEVSATTQEQTGMAEKMSGIAYDLNKVAEELQSSIAVFTV